MTPADMSAAGPYFSDRPATADEHMALREISGLGAFPRANTEAGLANTLIGVWLRQDERLVGMARVIGDGGCFALVCDVAIHPDLQRQGWGTRLMGRLMDEARAALPPRVFLTLIADPGAERLYERMGFASRHGMVHRLP